MSHSVRFTCLSFSPFPVLLLFCLTVAAQRKPEVPVDHRFDPLDQLFKQNEKELGKDYVALVWQDGKILYQKQGSDDFTPKMQAPVARAADWMTAALVMTFVDEGKISLDDKVTTYVPMFGKYMKGYITIRNCLTNTTGIKVDEGIKKALENVKFETLEDEVNSYASHRDIGTNPGTEIFYNYLGPTIAARCLEVVAKKPFERLMMERIIRPLKMRGTSFESQTGGAPNPSGGAVSAASDFISFMAMLMNKGVTPDGKRILSEKAVLELESPQFANLPIKYMPKELQGAQSGLGCYMIGTGNSAVLLSPNMLGTTAWIDKCRNYAAVLIVAKPEEPKKVLWSGMMNLINQQLGGNCN
ncbi:MAG TPA: serine hydrolase domain-containing protein [Puia sp.]|jgi:CubicO group peptidase (beta-lactamase class C family)|nr:serine hydrolase domain-containing protein [Puia sp.]